VHIYIIIKAFIFLSEI